MSEVATAITSSKVAEQDVHSFLPRVCGHLSIYTQNCIFDALKQLSDGAYRGGFWEFYELSNGGFYMAPVLGAPIRLMCDGNGFDGELSPEAAGIVATLFGVGRVLAHFEYDPLIEHYHRLRDFAMDHAEAWPILACID